MRNVKLFHASDEIQSEMIIDTLNEFHIPCYAKKIGSGEYLSITMGFSVYGQDIFVGEEDKRKALDIVEAFWMNEDSSEQETIINQEIAMPWYQDKVVVGRIIIAFIIVFIALAILVNLSQ